VVTCASCGAENREGARFCDSCAAPLAAPAHGGEERKVVSVLFVDLVGFTARSDRADPEDIRATLRPYHARVKHEIERYGGTVEKFVGDAVMAVFGAPVVHEDDAERAVRAALQILDAIAELNEAGGTELAVRAAVDTGEALVALSARSGEGAGIATGDVVNTASRLQNAAPIGGVVVGELTYGATRDAIVYEPLESVSLKGKAEPVTLWRATGARSRFGVDAEAARTSPFVGREHELRLLQETYARTVRDSNVQLVTVTGEPGVGKTRLLGELATFLDAQPELVHWRQGRCLPYGEGITFWALGEIVKAQAGILESDDPAETERKLTEAVAALAGDEAERDWLGARLAPLVGVSRGDSVERTESFTAWQRFFEALAAQRPLVLVLEDLQWADPALLEFLEHLVDLSSGVPLLVLCTGRPELYERYAGWGGGKRNSTTVSLSPLSDDDTARLVGALLERAVLPAATQRALLDQAGGNPLYAEEFVRMLTDRGILTRRGSTLEVEGDGEIPVPATVQALIEARVDTLPATRKALLHDAAVLGKVFWADALETMGGVEAPAVRDGLRELVRKELIRPARSSSVEGESEYVFWHALTRDVAYAQIPRAARARKHRAAGEWTEQIAGERLADHAELLAHHYVQALELEQAAGESADVGELRGRAVHFLLLAGERALGLDRGAAETHCRRALELATDDADRAQVLLWLGRCLNQGALYADSEEVLLEAERLFHGLGDRLGEGAALLVHSQSLWELGGRKQFWVQFDRGLELLEQEPPGSELVLAYGRRAGAAMHAEEAEACVEWSNRALALCDQLGLEEERVFPLQARGHGRVDLGDRGGLEDLREALRLALDLGLGIQAATAYLNLGDIVWWDSGPAEGQELYEAAEDFSERRNLTRQVIWSRVQTLWTQYELGRWDELLAVGEGLIVQARQRGTGAVLASASSYVALVRTRRGEAGTASLLDSEVLALAREVGDPQVLLPALTVAAFLEAMNENLGAALRLLEEREQVTRKRPNSQAAFFLSLAIRVAVSLPDLELADRLMAGAAESLPRFKHMVLTSRAVLEEARSEHEAAATHYLEAAEAWRDYGFGLEQAEALLGAGRCLLALERSDEAAPMLEQADGIFSALGAQPLLTDATRGNIAAPGA
jgi:class 3 adenylate cyclase